MKTETSTIIKEDIVSLGQMVGSVLTEMIGLMSHPGAYDLSKIEELEEGINEACQLIEEKCLDVLSEKNLLSYSEIVLLVSSITIGSKLERLADHANRVAKIACWAHEDQIALPSELLEMAQLVERMVQDVLVAFLTNDDSAACEIVQRDSRVDYLDDALSKKLLLDLGQQDHAQAQMRAQFLFAARFLERMGDACRSVAKRVYFISTGQRLGG